MSWLSTDELAQMRDDILNLLPDTCTILSVGYTSDGEGGMSETWGTATANVACRIDYRSGRENVAGGAWMPYSKAVLTLPFDTVLETTSRILSDGRTYAVLSANAGQSWIVSVRAELERVS